MLHLFVENKTITVFIQHDVTAVQAPLTYPNGAPM